MVLITNRHKNKSGPGGTATRYLLDGPGIDARWGATFSAPVQTGLDAHPAFYKWAPGLCRG